MSAASRWVSSAYVVAVAALAAASFDDPGATLTWFPEGLMLVLLLPGLVPMLPVVYLGGAFVWDLAQAGDGSPMWPVTTLYVLLFASVAVVNVVILRWVARRWGREGSA